jgi:hypothetical protein
MTIERRKNGNPAVTFRDFFNLVPNSLGDLVPTFELDCVDKPFFPFLVNRPDNYGTYVFPREEDYLAGGFSKAKKQKFDKWFREHKNEPFLLEEELASYGCNDTEILMSAMIKFREEYFEISKRPLRADGTVDRAASQIPHGGLDVLKECMTISGASMKHFRLNHLKHEEVSIFPERGYDTADNQVDF